MREGTFAIYKGAEYSADYQDNDDILLRSKNILDVNNGFIPNTNKESKYKCFRKVCRNEISELYNITNQVVYNGYVGYIVEEKKNKILIEIHNLLNEKAKTLQMDYATDKGIYVKWVNKSEVQIKSDKTEL